MTTQREPPTADWRGDLSRNGRASAAPVGRSEATLFQAYVHAAPVYVMADCTCGGVIRAMLDDWPGIATAIRTHQESTVHSLWRERVGL